MQPTPQAAEPGNRRILLVEDEQTIADVVRDYLVQAAVVHRQCPRNASSAVCA